MTITIYLIVFYTTSWYIDAIAVLFETHISLFKANTGYGLLKGKYIGINLILNTQNLGLNKINNRFRPIRKK